ncbi:MAG: GntR family transcriptional regulator [Chloroflexi bacterium]|nr:GntR family transcriptional regulator [Chloroflexota bacterium]
MTRESARAVACSRPSARASARGGHGLSGLTVPLVPSVEEAVTASLRQSILRGELRPGERLQQERLAERLGVSRIPLRDALRRLESEGLVRIDARKGAQVAELTAGDVREIYEFRILLEEHLTRLAIRDLDEAGARKLIEMSERVDRLVRRPVEAGEARRAFYSELYRHAHRERMRRIVLRLHDDVHRYHVPKNTDASRHDHDELRECIRTRNADRGARAIREHLRRACDELVEVLGADGD